MGSSNDNFSPNFRQRMAYQGYRIFTVLLVPLLIIQLLIRSFTRLKSYRYRIAERFGWVPKPAQPNGLLIHCVSVGEVVVASKLVNAILAERPNQCITVTTTTPTGSERLQQLLGGRVNHSYLPYDIEFALQRMLARIKPQQVLITEVELWPSLVHLCWQKKIPISIINGRMTERSGQRYAKLPWLIHPLLHKLHRICVQSERDHQQYTKLKAPKDKLILTHNIKFEVSLSDDDRREIANFRKQYQLNQAPQRPVLIAASTHEPEEDLILSCYQALLADHPNLLLILVPRHPQRFDKVADKLTAFDSARLSRSDKVTAETQILLGDTLGQLNALYGLADMAFVGGSIANKGGHNPLEASVHGIPCVMGSHTYNNPLICQILKQGDALVTIDNAEQMIEQLADWLANPLKCKSQGSSARAIIDSNQGAIDNTKGALGL